jgi:hypothetical protein
MGAMEYISNNKEWIFSGIGAVVIGVLIAFFQKTIVAFFKKKADGQNVIQEQKTGNGSVNIQSGENTNISLSYHTHTPENQPAATQPQLYTLTPETILDELEKLPPLQVPGAIKHYCGIRVKWQGKVQSVDKVSEHYVRLRLRWGNRLFYHYFIKTDVKLADYPELAVVKKETEIEVEGTIKEVDSPCISLCDDAIIRLL